MKWLNKIIETRKKVKQIIKRKLETWEWKSISTTSRKIMNNELGLGQNIKYN